MKSLRATPRTELLELYFSLNLLFVLVRIIIPPFTNGTAHRDKGIGSLELGHGENDSGFRRKRQITSW
jgi:hypothetical protein